MLIKPHSTSQFFTPPPKTFPKPLMNYSSQAVLPTPQIIEKEKAYHKTPPLPRKGEFIKISSKYRLCLLRTIAPNTDS